MLSLITPFWRPEPFTVAETALLEALFNAHYRSAFRDNVSTVTLLNAAAGSGQLTQAIAAAILTTGAKHAPLVATATFLAQEYPQPQVPAILSQGHKIPGWGSSFHKGSPDPIWAEFNELLAQRFPLIDVKLVAVTASLHRLGKPLYPNASAYTAAAALAIGLPAPLCPYLFVAARLSAWTQLAAALLVQDAKLR